MKITPYHIPAQLQITEQEIKKSRFLTYLSHTATVSDAKAFISHIKSLHPQARHWCSAFVAGRPDDPTCLGFSDDGEPSGTAGKPMLFQLQGSGLGEITAVVVRYYGGIRLGTGGLVKAYGGGVQLGLTQLSRVEKQVKVQCHLSGEYSHITIIETLLTNYGGVQLSCDFSHIVNMTVEIDARHVEAFLDALTQRSRGKIHIATI